ncbi:MAG TPA: hypothetical protein VKU82_14565 [Planctomycetaceae bacterium]|nr:hypothetical protein [Planctomycetaceae bacterium]
MTAKDQAAVRLAHLHYATEPALVQVYRLRSEPAVEEPESEPVKLLEINPDTFPFGIMPLAFDAHPASGILFPSVIIEITPDEFQEIQAGNLQLPNHWQLGDLIPPPLAENGRVLFRYC